MANDPVLAVKVCVTSPCHLNDYTSATSFLKKGTTNECIVSCAADEYYNTAYECKGCADDLVNTKFNLILTLA